MFSLFETFKIMICASCVKKVCILSQKKINFSYFPVNLWIASFMVYAFHPRAFFQFSVFTLNSNPNICYFPLTAVNYLGCYFSPSGMVEAGDYNAGTLTPQSCVTRCGKANMKYAGLTSGSECYCSNTPPDFSKDIGNAACYYPCLGNKALKCGSHSYYSVYDAPKQFDFPFSLSVAISSEAFQAVQIATTPLYDSADVLLDFGDGITVTTNGSSYAHVFTSFGLHEVFAFCLFGGRGEGGL